MSMRAELLHTVLLADLFAPLKDPIARRAVLELVLIGIPAGAVGCWVILYGLSYGAESLSHSLLPGLVLAVLVGAPLTLGALGAAVLAAAAIAASRQLPSVESDTAIAVVITTLFGTGVIIALSRSSPPGLADLLFGDVLGVSNGDLVLAGLLALLMVVALRFARWRLLAVGFDRGGAGAMGLRPIAAELGVLILMATVVVVAVQALGNLLVLAILIGPAMVGRRLAATTQGMIFAAAASAALAGVAGIYGSYYLGTAAGASVVVALIGLHLAASGYERLRAVR
jgi:ABC-type Mn2+/Zn2+ transport system permease subunit